MAAKRISTRRYPGTAEALFALLAFLTPPALANDLPTATNPRVVAIQFQTENGWQYDGRVELPPKD